MEKSDKLALKAHYIKDISFENPNYSFFFGSKEKFQIENFNFKINSRVISEKTYEIELIIMAHQEISGKSLFAIDFNYAGIFYISNDKNNEIQLVKAPELLYFHSKKILSEIFRVGGFSKIKMPEVNFLSFYQKNNK